VALFTASLSLIRSLSLSLSLLFVIDQRDEATLAKAGGSNMQARCYMNAAYGSTYFCGSMSLLFWSRQSLHAPSCLISPN